MLLAVDAGNTHTVYGLFEGEKLCANWRISTRKETTSDEQGVLLRSLFKEAGLRAEEVKGMIVSSVVPEMDAVLAETGKSYFGIDPFFICPGIKTGLPILYDNPHEVGADRIVNAVAAKERMGSPVLILDFGTATTLDVVSSAGEYLGGIIAPGIGISAEALFEKAARLSPVDIRCPERVIGRNTVESIQAGLYFGYVSLIEGIVGRTRSELGTDAPVIATGGLAPVIAKEASIIEVVDPGLTLEGLMIIWAKNRR